MGTSVFVRLASAVRNQWQIVTAVIAIGIIGAACAAFLSHTKYTATTTVLMVAEPPQAANPGVPATATKPLLSMDLPSLVTDPTVLSRFRNDIGESISLEKLRLRIRAKISLESNIMPVDYTAESPEKAIRGADALSDEVVRFYREIATKRFDSLIADFNDQLARRRSQLMRYDGELAAAAKLYPYIDVSAPGAPPSEANSVYVRLIAMQTERDALRETADADAAAAQTTSRLISDAGPLAERDIVNSDSNYRNVRDQYAKDFAALKKLSAFGKSSYPGMVELRATVDREAAMVSAARRNAAGAGPASNPTYVAALDAQAKADALYASDRAKLQEQDTLLRGLHAQIGRGSVATNVSRLRRDRDSAEAAYATIAARLANAIADRAEAASTGSVIVLDRAQFAPRVLLGSGMVAAVGIMFLALWLALTLAMMIDGMHEWFRDTRTIEKIYGTSFIGSIA